MSWVQLTPSAAAVHTFTGVQDFQESTTVAGGGAGAVDMPLADTWYDLTNDGAGPLSTQAYAVAGHGALWNTTTDEFDFSALKVGDLLRIRLEVEFLTSAPNVQVAMRMVFGPSFAYDLPIQRKSFKNAASAGEGRLLRYFSFQVKSTDVQSNPAKFQVASDTAGTDIIVYGWQIETLVI